ncbi:EamA family transporter [Sneathiella sp. P13V-1]|uniref:DMT family transporter n=1 Tax=Sneathiella sp. P13V-1 TaxID=2697366 RepID=UPI00187B67C6|nr:DMT family transporter [Sneathiella sp. P13V-1]MBE7636162.1 EamA family transporter [Sneathiella sp. P13V-1]
MQADDGSGGRAWPKAGDLYLIASVFAWGVNFPIAKLVLDYMPPLVFSASRYFAASAFLFALLALRGDSLKITMTEAVRLFGIGLLGIALFQGGWAYGLSLTSASKASILVATSPVFAIFIVTVMGEKTSLKAWLGVFVSLFGVAIIINNSFSEITIGGGSLIGDLLIIGAAAVWAIYTVVSGPMVQQKGPLLVTAWAMLFGACILTAVDFNAIAAQQWTAIPTKGWIAWSMTALLGAALAFVWYCSGIVRLGVARGMAYSFLIPIIAIATSILFFEETMTWIQIAGVAVVMGGIQMARKN